MQYQVSKDAYQVIPDIAFISWSMLMSGGGVRDVFAFCVLGHLFFPNFHTHHLLILAAHKGIGANMLKVGIKRRRTKTQVEAEKEEALLKE